MSSVQLKHFLLSLICCLVAPLPAARADENAPNSRDVLVYQDGDRVQGRLTGEQDKVIVFQSDRFGELRVPAKEAVVIRAEKPVPAAVAPVAAAPRAEADREAVWEFLSPAMLTAGLRNVFGSWHGRVAFSTEVVADTADRNNLSLETSLRRKWEADAVELKGRYDYNQTNNLTTTDMIKGDGLWRHDFSPRSFGQYRPSVEWNRANFVGKTPSDYVLLQQEIGAGVSLVNSKAHKVRVGVSENLFNVWNTGPDSRQNSRAVESAFLETELRMPWSLLLTERGVYYYSLNTRDGGWENRVELTKKFTETLSTAIRHETRQNSPDGRAQDYTRLKLLLGVDF